MSDMKPTFNYILNDLALSSLIFRTVDSNEVASEQDKIDMKYQIDLLKKEEIISKQALIDIREYVNTNHMIMTPMGVTREWLDGTFKKDILQIIDKVLGDGK